MWNDLVLPFITGGAGAAVVVWLARLVITERVSKAIAHQYDSKLERLRAELHAEVQRKVSESGAAIAEQARLTREKWRLKRRACLRALNVVDRVFTQHRWEGLSVAPEWRDVTVDELREVYNHLALSLDSKEVLDLYVSMLGMRNEKELATPISADALQDLRNAIRRELGFGANLDLDRKRVWIAVHQTQKSPAPSQAPRHGEA